MIRLTLGGNALDFKQSASHLFKQVMHEIAATPSRRSCTVEISFEQSPDMAPLRFRITYLGPSRRASDAPPPMTGNRSK